MAHLADILILSVFSWNILTAEANASSFSAFVNSVLGHGAWIGQRTTFVVLQGDYELEDIKPLADRMSAFVEATNASSVMAAVEAMDPEPAAANVIFIKTDSPNQLMRSVDQLKWAVFFEWLVPRSSVEGIAFRLDSKIYAYQPKDSGQGFLAKEVYSVKGGPPKEQGIGVWDAGNGGAFIMTAESNIWERRSNLTGTVLNNFVLAWGVFVQITYDEDGGISDLKGPLPEAFQAVADRLGIEVQNFEPADGKWGGKQEDGTWNGIVGTIARREGDISSATVGLTNDRREVVSFAMSTFVDSLTLHVADTAAVGINWWVYIDIFSWGSWTTLAGGIVCLGLGFACVSLSKVEKLHEKGDPENFNLINGVSLVVIVLMQLDYKISKIRMATKILYWTTCTGSVLFFAFYTAILTSRMTVNPAASPIRSFRDAVNNEYKVMYLGHSWIDSILKHSPEGSALHDINLNVREEGEAVSTFATKDEAVSRMTDEPKMAVLANAHYFDSYKNVKTLKLNDALRDVWAYPLQKDSEFKEILDYTILKLYETGTLERIIDWWMQKPIDVKQDEATPLGYENLIFPFTLGFIGLAGATTAFVLERLSWSTKSISSAARDPNRSQHLGIPAGPGSQFIAAPGSDVIIL